MDRVVQRERASRRKPRRPSVVRRMALFPLIIFYMEAVLRLWSAQPFWGVGFLYALLFSVGVGFICNLLTSLLPMRAGQVMRWVFLWVFTLFFGVQVIFYSVFRTYVEFGAMAMAGNVVDFFAEAVQGFFNNLLPVFLLLLPVALCQAKELMKRRPIRQKELLRVAIITALLHVLVIGSIVQPWDRTENFYLTRRAIYQEQFSLNLAATEFGLLTATRLDIFGRPEADVSAALALIASEGDEQEEPREPESIEPVATPEPTPEPEIVFDYNILDIDFEVLMETETRAPILEMHEFFSRRPGTQQNEFTGMFEGKNLIWICGEAFHTLAIHPEITPTLYRMSTEGFIFPNFYTPDTGFSTTGGEFGTLLGLIPTQRHAFRDSHTNYLPFAFGNMFREQGYATFAYHNHTYTFYRRDLSHPNMGYIFRAVGNGLNITRQWPASDVEMIQDSVGDFINEERFHVYYMTVSGHLEYNFYGNNMAFRHREAVAALPYSTGPRAFLATQMELDLSMQYLIDALDAVGQLENTVFVISGDHYPYGLTHAEMEELGGRPLPEPIIDAHHSALLIWSASMTEPVVVETFGSFYDVMPTLANLFALPFDSRLVIGTDLLSDAEPFVPFASRSWISQLGRFNSRTGEFTPHPGIDEADIPENHVQQMQARFLVEEHFSGQIMAHDYYRIVLGR